jgi:hypothetical protein
MPIGEFGLTDPIIAYALTKRPKRLFYALLVYISFLVISIIVKLTEVD